MAAAAGAVVIAVWFIDWTTGARIMPSYLAAWLFGLALPAGALPLVMVAELVGWDNGFVHALRRLLILMPPLAVAVLPILFTLPAIFPWAAAGAEGWFTIPLVCGRVIVGLGMSTLLALLLLRPPLLWRAEARPTAARGGRRLLCIIGLMLQLVIVTSIATDLVLALNPGMNSAGFGILLLTAECSVAIAAAALLVPSVPAGVLLLASLAAWGYMHFIQFLIVWSANKPGEIGFILARENWLGEAAVWFGTAAFLPALLLAWLRRPPVFLPRLAAGCILLAHGIEAIWLVTP